MNYSTVIVAAGSGSRSGLSYNKVFYQLPNGKRIIQQTLELFLKDNHCSQIVLVCKDEERADFQALLPYEKIIYASGGATRSESVYQGLLKVKEDYVLIHDGARPYLDQDSLSRLLMKLNSCVACLLMVPTKDTIKVVENGVVKHTPNRETLWCAQTPQAFQKSLLKECYEKLFQHPCVVTDDASVVEQFGYVVEMVMGSYENRKITTPDDLL